MTENEKMTENDKKDMLISYLVNDLRYCLLKNVQAEQDLQFPTVCSASAEMLSLANHLLVVASDVDRY